MLLRCKDTWLPSRHGHVSKAASSGSGMTVSGCTHYSWTLGIKKLSRSASTQSGPWAGASQASHNRCHAFLLTMLRCLREKLHRNVKYYVYLFIKYSCSERSHYCSRLTNFLNAFPCGDQLFYRLYLPNPFHEVWWGQPWRGPSSN